MPLHTSIRSALRLAAVAALAACAAVTVAAEEGAKDYSPAERAIFMSDHLAKVHAPATLNYTFRRTGSLETAFDDKVAIQLKPAADGSCCSASGEFLSGERHLVLPDIDEAKANPVILYFLEHDVRDMQRLTKGQQGYFRKRIRMAIYDGASLRDVSLKYRGEAVAAHEIAIAPYTNDPNRSRFEKFADKQYVFTLSDAVPGGIYAIRSQVADKDKPAGAPPLIAEELLLDGAEPNGTR
ncbi:MAG: hypothetical protein JSR59_05705 [Proteobacteria bacterium]|nr:hypothetical protein [Pseudomonadota bacterium]